MKTEMLDIEATILDALTVERPVDDLLISVSNMRARMAQENGTKNLWNVKHVRGGLVDCEFIAQYLQLRHAYTHPEILNTGTVSAYRKLAVAGLLPEVTAVELISATRLWRRLQGLLRLTFDGPHDPASFSPPLQQLLAEAGRKTNFEALKTHLRQTAEMVYYQFRTVIEVPAETCRAALKTTQNKD